MPEQSHETSQHSEDRTPLAFAYTGTDLIAVGYREEIVKHWEDETAYTVSRTPAGEETKGGLL